MSQNIIRAYAASASGEKLQAFEYDAGELKGEELEIKIDYCGICHSDLSMLKNDFGMSQYPLVPGHEVVGKVARMGERVKGLSVGQTVGVGWFSSSCTHCFHCLDGEHHLCREAEGIIVGRHGGFADKVRVHWSWATPLPAGVDASKAGPLFCGGITVFNPIVEYGVRPTDRVGVVGIGGLGHMALQFLNKWGCEVTAFTSTAAKAEEAKTMGAHQIINSRDDGELMKAAGRFDFLLVTVNVALNWDLYINTLAPKGKLHFVGAVLEPIKLSAMSLIMGQRSVSGTPLGSPANVKRMLDFCARHEINPITEHHKMSEVNAALEHLEAGNARYRIILENDFA